MSSPGSSESPSLSTSCDQSCRQPVFETYHLSNYEMNVDVLETIKTGTLCSTRAEYFSLSVFRKVCKNIQFEHVFVIGVSLVSSVSYHETYTLNQFSLSLLECPHEDT